MYVKLQHIKDMLLHVNYDSVLVNITLKLSRKFLNTSYENWSSKDLKCYRNSVKDQKREAEGVYCTVMIEMPLHSRTVFSLIFQSGS